mmetsp:Transcript_20413/g.36680  ORF Transcript_20413/g.36680 Transcript_20413/m.36680 type:complete len:220 (-) Transcript_20413:207-866(-)
MMAQLHPEEPGSGAPPEPVRAPLAPPTPAVAVLPFFVEFFFVPPPIAPASGLTATLTGVGCVLNTGMSQPSNVFVSGDSIPFPMHISLILSPPEHAGISSGHNDSNAPLTSPIVSAGLQSSITCNPSLFAKINLRDVLSGSYTKGTGSDRELDVAAGAGESPPELEFVAASPFSLPAGAEADTSASGVIDCGVLIIFFEPSECVCDLRPTPVSIFLTAL